MADQIADDHQPGRDPYPGLQCDGFAVEPAHRIDDAKTRTDSPLGIVLMRPRVAEIDQNAVTHVLGDKAIELGDHFGDGAVVGADQLPQILRIKPRCERRRADEIGKHHRQLAAFGVGGSRCIRGRRRHCGGEHRGFGQ